MENSQLKKWSELLEQMKTKKDKSSSCCWFQETKMLRWKCLTAQYLKKPLKVLPVLKDFLKTVSVAGWKLNLTVRVWLRSSLGTNQHHCYNEMGVRHEFLELCSRDLQKWLGNCRNIYDFGFVNKIYPSVK